MLIFLKNCQLLVWNLLDLRQEEVTFVSTFRNLYQTLKECFTCNILLIENGLVKLSETICLDYLYLKISIHVILWFKSKNFYTNILKSVFCECLFYGQCWWHVQLYYNTRSDRSSRGDCPNPCVGEVGVWLEDNSIRSNPQLYISHSH